MGFFDPPDVKVRNKLRPDVKLLAEKLVKLVHEQGGDLTSTERREVEFVTVMHWLQDQTDRHGLALMGQNSMVDFFACKSEGVRISHNFRPNQVIVAKECLRIRRENPEVYDVAN
ncbi:hypothetical protein [Brevundimonas aveniformis]|uniref:hypothetical protein n=1 Tax=Brevundimonas aveniformis TaxID=370977 RepID=UPI00048A7D5E|nr:hypothetical protein [Brevundimonas aveniformis]